ncbi:MAG: FAD-dependent oxidoreductase [Pseudomonadota bacterium]
MRAGKGPPDVTILGAGIIGVATALNALERGLSVEIIDERSPGEATSFGNAGVISPFSVVPQCLPGIWKDVPRWLLDPRGPVKLRWRNLPQVLPWALSFLRNATPERVNRIADAMALLMQHNVDVYRRHLAGTGHEGLIVDAMNVTVFRGAAKPNMQDLALSLRTARGAGVEIIDQSDLRDLEPAIATEYHSAALIKGQARALDPGALCKILADKARSAGAVLRRIRIAGLERDAEGSIALRTAEGSIATRKLILAGGIWSRDLLAQLGYRLPLIAERGYHLEFPDPGVSANHSIQDAAAKVILSSMRGGIRVAGTAEFAHIDAPPNYARARALSPLAKRLLPDLNIEGAREWMGIRPSFPDNLPAIGPMPDLPNLIAAFGHSHYGLGMAPVTARLAVDHVIGAPNTDLSAVSPNRFLRD